MSVQHIIANWKTSSVGLLMCLGSLTHLGFAIHLGTLTETMVISEMTTFIGGIGLIFAGDASKSAKDLKQVDAKAEKTITAVVTGNTEMLTKPTEIEPPKV